MLHYASGNLLEAPQLLIAHGVNCQGVMGRGLALRVRRAYPEVWRAYSSACRAGTLRPGKVQVVRVSQRWVANLATQDSWGTDSPRARPEWIRECLGKLVNWCRQHQLDELATVRLGCGLGGLTWERVEPVFREVAQGFDLWVYQGP